MITGFLVMGILFLIIGLQNKPDEPKRNQARPIKNNDGGQDDATGQLWQRVKIR